MLTDDTGRPASPGDVTMLAGAMSDAAALARGHALADLSLGRMVDGYEDLCTEMLHGRLAA